MLETAAYREGVSRVKRLRLSPLARYCLAACYSDGSTPAEVGERIGKSADAVESVIRRASEKLAAAGLPRPRPYGVGSRAEFRRAFPMLDN